MRILRNCRPSRLLCAPALIVSSLVRISVDMENNKKIYQFFGKPGEDFFLKSAWTVAALAAKEVLLMIENDVLSVNEAPSH